MANIYQISQELLAIFEELEENEGELTPELEEQLNITQDQFKDKIKSYADAIKELESDIVNIKAEKVRLNDLQKSKEKTVERLKKIMAEAIETFGDTTKSGSKFVDYGTGKISIRNTQAIEIDEDVTNRFVNRYLSIIKWYANNNQLDTVSADEILDYCNNPSPSEEENKEELIPLTYDDLSLLKTNIELDISVDQLLNTERGMKLAKAISEFALFTCKAKADKVAIKNSAKSDKHFMPAYAKLVNNKSVIIK